MQEKKFKDNAEWQVFFCKLKETIKPSSDKKMKYTRLLSSRVPVLDWESAYVRYCTTINDILSVIRSGEEDYCFYIYQVSDLLRFEHDRLCVDYLPDEGCFKVYLTNCKQALFA